MCPIHLHMFLNYILSLFSGSPFLKRVSLVLWGQSCSASQIVLKDCVETYKNIITSNIPQIILLLYIELPMQT